MTDEQFGNEADRFLVGQIQAGRADAFRRLVDRFGGRLKAFASKSLAGSGIDPEDAVQETFLSLLRSIESLGEVRSLQAYLFTILRRRIADLARGRGPTAVSLNESRSSGGAPPAGPEPRPSTYARRDEALGARAVVLADVLEAHLSRL